MTTAPISITLKLLTLSEELYQYLNEPPEITAVALGRDIILLAAPGWRVHRTGTTPVRYSARWKPDPEIPLITGGFDGKGEFWKHAAAIRILGCLSRGELSPRAVQTPKPRKVPNV